MVTRLAALLTNKKGPGRSPGHSLISGTYQTRHEFVGIIGWPTLQPNALPNSSKFCTVPFVLHSPVLCGSVFASTRAFCSVWFWHHTCPNVMKNRCAGVYPSFSPFT